MEAKERKVWAIRGAVTVDSNSPDDVDSAVKEMLDAIYKENHITEDDVVFTLFSQTQDITKRNAAAAARKGGYSTHTPLFCQTKTPCIHRSQRCSPDSSWNEGIGLHHCNQQRPQRSYFRSLHLWFCRRLV